MSSPQPVVRRFETDMSVGENSPLDVDWLLRSKKDHSQATGNKAPLKKEPEPQPAPQSNQTEPTPPQSPVEAPSTQSTPAPITNAAPETTAPATVNGSSAASQPSTPKAAPSPATTPPSLSQSQSHQNAIRPSLGTRQSSNDESKNLAKGAVNSLKKESGRRSSWISNLSSKFSSSNSPSPARSTSVDSQAPTKIVSPQPSPGLEFQNPFNKKETTKDGKKEIKKETKNEGEQPVIITHTPGARRPSVLVAAGKETKLDSPGFLSSALRRLSSSNNTTLGKGAGSGAVGVRKIMNIDHNRERIKIQEFDQNKLKRVAFCVDVEIAGFAAQGDEEVEAPTRPPMSAGQGQRLSLSAPSPSVKKDSKDAKYKDMGEGAALKNPGTAAIEKEDNAEVKADAPAEVKESQNVENGEKDETAEPKSEPQPIPTTRKKEKKKRSEAERKERRERKRRHAEANGLVPLELTRDDDSSDSSPNNTPPGASTPKKSGDQPTTDPLRIYKRCCQLRETTVLSRVKEQISKPSATLAEAPGTVAVIDLSGLQMQLQDVVTLGDWLAVVPVRKLILDDCNLSDEAVRVILSGLVGCKTAEQAKQNRKLPKRPSGKRGQEQMGVIEKLSLKNNTHITNIGWKHIALFLHISKSLKAIDLSGIPFPKGSGDLSRTSTLTSQSANSTNGTPSKSLDLGRLITRAVGERLGDKLEELILSGCELSTKNVSEIVDCALKCKIRRLGLAENKLDQEGLAHVVRYLKSGACEGLDLGGNNLHSSGHLIADAVDHENPLFAISFAGCNLTSDDLSTILIPFIKLKNLKFIDLSRNHALFSGSKNAVPVFRKLLPRLTSLKRIHLADAGLTSDHVIALAEILPDCAALCHISILENEQLVRTMNAKDGASQEEACAYFASLMTAVRVSQSIIAIEIEVPSAESSEVVKALASQVVAYSLRNMERSALDEVGVHSSSIPSKDASEVLLHLVGHMDGYSENHDNDEPAPDEDYMIASTGIVKALSVCLGSKDGNSRTHSRNISPTASGTATPRQGAQRPKSQKKPRDVSLELCETARKIRMRLRPALIKEDRAGNDTDYRRLLLLDQTLQRMIQRFEDEYPETKVPAIPSTSPGANGTALASSPLADASVLSASPDASSLSKTTSTEDYLEANERQTDAHALQLSRTSSHTSLAAKAYTDEEGRMHRFGQSMRREVLKPTGTTDYAHGTSVNDEPEPAHLAALRARMEEIKGDDIRRKVELEGADNVIREIGVNAEELKLLQREDPAEFEAFRNSQLAAQINNERVKENGVWNGEQS